jgi:glycosyltransferase involved in cell wall biosynthesis
VNQAPLESRIGLVHDYLLTMRGAERAFSAVAQCWPGAPVYTTLYSVEGTERRFEDRQVHTSYLQFLRIKQKHFRRALPLYPLAVERLPVQSHDLIVSSSSAFAHGVKPRAGAVHICYCYTPFRYAWHERDLALGEVPRYARPFLRWTLDRIRNWDRAVSARVTHYVAISRLTQQRIADCYEREASIVYPPVETKRFSPGGAPENFFLIVTELTRHKRVDVALEAARRAQRPVKVVGEGPELRHLRATFDCSAHFLGRVSDAELADLYSRACALVVPNIEEFGIAAVEAQAAGRPVVATDAGGARETVIDGETGILIPGGSSDGFAEALRHVDFHAFSAEKISHHAEQFSIEAFRERFLGEVRRVAGELAS